MERRTALTAGIGALTTLGAAAAAQGAAATPAAVTGDPAGFCAQAPALPPVQFDRLVAAHPEPAPRTELAIALVADLAETVPMGMGPLGERRIVPILGGRFEGPGISGTVVPGGADRQLVRRDGARVLEARYELRTDDGYYISVVNTAIVDGDGASRYARSTTELTAPDGPHAWLNKRKFVGTVTSLRPERAAVLIRIYTVL